MAISSEIEILVRVKDQATAELAAIAAKAREVTASSGSSEAVAIHLPLDVDKSRLQQDLATAVKSAEPEHAVVPVEADSSRFDRDVASAVHNAKSEPVVVAVDADVSKLEQDIDNEAKGVKPEPVAVPVEADASKLEVEAEAKVKAVKTSPIKVPLEVDGAAFEAELLASFAEGEKHADEASKAMLSSFKALESGIRALRAASDELKPAAEAADDFETEFRKAMDEGARVSEDADREMRRSFTSMESGSRALRAALTELAPAAENAGKKIADSGNGFSLAALKMPALISGALALGPALAAIPAVTAAVVVGAGAMTLGFGGVISALKDYGQQTVSSGQSGAQLAQTEFSNAVAIRNAQQAITDAKKQAAQAAQSSANQIYSAQERVAQSAYSMQQAEQTLADAEKSEENAQKALTQARLDAANQLKDLNNQAADSVIAVQQAELNLTEARENLIKVTSSGLSTDDQKRQAQIDLQSATQGLKDAQQKQIESQQAADAANKSGVDGMANVVSAQDAVTKGAQGVASAQHGVADAAQAQKDAQTALARAVQASAQQQADSAEAIQKAVQNLADTQKQQALAAAAAASSGGASVNKFAQDMANLTPAGQAFVNQLLGMKGGFDQLKATAQTSLLPGFMPLLAGLSDSMPGINKAIDAMGHLIGGVATQFGQLLQSPAFRGELGKIFNDGLNAAKTFASGVVPMVEGVTNALSKAGPIVQGIANGFHTLMTSGIPDFFSGLTSNANGAGNLFQNVLTLVSNIAGPLGTISGAMATALAPAFQVLASPQVQQALQSLANSIAQILIVLSPVVTMIAQGLAGALRIAAPLLQSLAKFLQDNQTWVVPLAKGIALAAIAFWGLNAALAANPIVLVGMALAGLVLGLIYAWEHFAGFRDFMKAMWRDIQIGFDAFLGFVKKWWPELLAPFTLGASEIVGHWNSIVDFTKKLPGRLASAAAHIWDWVTQLWDKYVAGPVSKAFDTSVSWVAALPGRFARAGAGLWDWIRDSFKTAINTVIGWWNSLSFGIPKVHIPGTDIDVGGGTIGVPQIPYFARGGVLPAGLTAAIGDGGWEPLRLPDGTTVVPHANAQSAMNSATLTSGGAGGRVQVELVSSGAEDYFLRFLRHAIRVRGGNVQTVLGVN